MTIPVSSERAPAALPPSPVYRPFLAAALALALTFGFTTGAMLFLTEVVGAAVGSWWMVLAQGHGVAQLFGWAGLFIVGIGFHVVPRFRSTPLAFQRLATLPLALIPAGIILRVASQGYAGTAWGALGLLLSGLALLSGVGVAALMLIKTLRRGTRTYEPFEPWFLAGMAWAVIGALIHAGIVLHLVAGRVMLVSPSPDAAFAVASLLGFLLNCIIGVSVRIVPAFMGLPHPPARLLAPAWWAFNLGVAWLVLAVVAAGGPVWYSTGVVLWAAGVVLAVTALGVFRPRLGSGARGPGVYRGYNLYIRTAYGWLLGAVVLGLFNALGSALAWPSASQVPFALVRHVVALGFVTMMILGMASRMLPAFESSSLQGHRLMHTAFVLLNASVALRVVFSVVDTAASPALLGVSGIAGLAAIVLFAAAVWRTLSPTAREQYRQTVHIFVQDRLMASGQGSLVAPSITAQSIVAQVLEQWPETLEVFLRNGLTQLADLKLRRSFARTITIGEVARLLDVNPESLLRALNQAASKRPDTAQG